MIDFTNAPQTNKLYAGANGGKIPVIYDDELYMLKFPSIPTKNPDLSYTNSCYSEYIGCKIYKSIGIPVQDVLMGTYTTKSGKTKTVVACKDFTANETVILQDFASLKNRIVDSERNGYGTELNDILTTFDEQTIIDKQVLSNRFWDMFIVDSLIGNWDRHNGNWGILYDKATDAISLAPVFDCGSSLFPQADENTIRNTLCDKGQLNDRVFNRPTSAITQNGKRINYFDFISSCKNEDCNKALERIQPLIDMNEINEIVDNTPMLADDHKLFLKTILQARKERIIDFSYSKLLKSKDLDNTRSNNIETKNHA